MIHCLVFPAMEQNNIHSIVSMIEPLQLPSGELISLEYSYDYAGANLQKYVEFVNERTIWDDGYPLWDADELRDDGNTEYLSPDALNAYLERIRSVHRIFGTVYLHIAIGMHQIKLLHDEFKNDIVFDVIDVPIGSESGDNDLVDAVGVYNMIKEYNFTVTTWRGGYRCGKNQLRAERLGYTAMVDELKAAKG